MIYHQKNKNNKSNKKIRNFVIVIILITLFFVGQKFFDFVHLINLSINNFKTFVQDSVSPVGVYFKSKNDLISKNKQLIEDNKKLKISALMSDFYQQENSQLKSIIEYKDPNTQKVFARVVNSPRNSPQDTFVIDVGEEILNIGDKIFHLNVPIGFVDELYRNSSVVRLYSAKNQKIPVEIYSDDAIILSEAIGSSSGNFKMSIPKDISINVDDSVFFENHLIGQVGGIEFDSSNTFQNVYFVFPFSISEIKFVEIIKNN
ncbi:MAG TPA: rod shape-determining protein MreC [Candidatus Paceibacterota bacterium]|nr:rod shape-determining protein MreC [Candidatus Paceibacterota bacterium]